jgi:acyl-CoA reductase-like NAD-dependent aldehyde dehydrogenase
MSYSNLTSPLVAPFIEGVSVQSRASGRHSVINPSSGGRLFEIPSGCEEDVDQAVAVARRAFDDGRWSDAAPSYKKKTLHSFANLIESHAKELDTFDAEEMGKPLSLGFGNATAAASIIRFYAEAVDKVLGDVYTSDSHSFAAQRRVPRGVVAAIVPWNFPTFNAVYKLGPALAAGNCVVLKPSELSSRTAIVLAQLAIKAGIPPGVVNVVPGLGELVGRALGLHRDVDMVAFTGSSPVGKLMLQYAGQSNMKAVMAECGGKSPQIVFADGVDLDAASKSIAQLLLINQGQLCTVGSRVLVQKSIEKVVIEKISEHLGNATIGDAMNPSTIVGPLASSDQCTRVMRYIDSGRVEGARLVTGGRRALLKSGGYFVEPTVFGSVSPSAKIAQEEIFGPVLSVIPFNDEADAIRIANGTPYGLVAYVWTANLSTGMRMAKGVRSSVLINACPPLGEGPGHAFSTEPVGQSGVGTESGLAGMESYLRRHLIWVNHA